MNKNPNTENEQARVKALLEYDIIDTENESVYDSITSLAAKICSTPIALLGFIDAHRQWFKSCHGFNIKEVKRDISFCEHVIQQDDVYIIPDASKDKRFSDNPLVLSQPCIRFYAGVPLITSDGHKIGTICVVDNTTRIINENQISHLKSLSSLVLNVLESRKKNITPKSTSLILTNSRMTKTGGKSEHVQNEIKFRNIVDDLPALVWMTDCNGVCVYSNNTYFQTTGQKLNHTSLYERCKTIHPEDYDKYISHFKKGFILKNTINIEYRIRKSDGNYAWVVETAIPRYNEQNIFLGYFGSCTDITKQKEFEQNANDAQRMAHLGSRIWRFTDNIEIWSDELYRILGLNPKEIDPTHDDFIKFIHPDDYPDVLKSINEAINKRKTFKINYRIIRKSGEIRFLQCVGEIRFNNYMPISLHSSIHDVTELKKVDEMKNEFVSTVSHELRTPLTSIKGALGLIMSGKFGNLDSSIEELIQISYRNSSQLIRIINDILDIHKIESGRMKFKFEYTNISELINQTIEDNQGYAAQFNVKIKSNIDENIESRVDADRISQVLSNLISNAIKFSPRGGEIWVFAKKSNNKVHVGVKDNGPGIPTSFKDKIFHKFEQADSSDTRSKNGTGLGLSICKAIIEEHKGLIGYNSKTGDGTTFYFEIP